MQATDETAEETTDLSALLNQEEDETDTGASIIDMLKAYSTNTATGSYSVVDYLA